MAQLVERLHEVITVERSGFLLRDQDGTLDEPAGWPGLAEISARLSDESWFEATLNWAVFLSTAPWHDSEVTLELWDGPPPDDTATWERSRVQSFYSSSGMVYLSEMSGSGPPSVPMDLRRDAGEWAIRASSRPGSGWNWPDEEAAPSGAEEWRIQLWPSTGIDSGLTHAPRRTSTSPSVRKYVQTLSRLCGLPAASGAADRSGRSA
ncbi:hypothetical protein Sme01_64270 [Sphaerisporangium melleum]|uniref:Uncharacterized protein n=1 Tax=Sphaerisporangium melleum TaxID=321316 RepID=A0A917VQP4_9ACTN|nr:hypothetical protein GCM10007964_53940 [Sphaerisporangium melleum]GII73951.1 hypothetical protein Sme01_64270 [Sphaerisporangium melleum]